VAVEKYPIHSVRLDDEVWKAVKAHAKSLNQILRDALGLNGEPPPPANHSHSQASRSEASCANRKTERSTSEQ